MPDLLAPRFGANIDPTLPDLGAPFARAAIADRAGLDLIAVQDHPYNRRMLETWTLLSMLAARTGRVHLVTNVANIPLRPPAMLAKQAATLDLLSGGRVELGIGAGAFWQGITAYGVPHRAPGEAYGAFKDALTIIRGMLDHAGGSFSYEGKFYRVEGARPGPGPAHRIPIWAGAVGPRMLRASPGGRRTACWSPFVCPGEPPPRAQSLARRRGRSPGGALAIRNPARLQSNGRDRA